jgi:hypothetical protein
MHKPAQAAGVGLGEESKWMELLKRRSPQASVE